MDGARVKRNLENFIANNDYEEFGLVEIQKYCRISRNNALRVLNRGLGDGSFSPVAKLFRARMVRDDG